MIQLTRVIDNNYCVLFPNSRFPYLICVPDSGNGSYHLLRYTN